MRMRLLPMTIALLAAALAAGCATTSSSSSASGASGAGGASAMPAAAAATTPVSYEAESPDNTFGPDVTTTDSDVGGLCSGGHYVGYLGNSATETLRFNKINAPRAGDYIMTIYYMTAEDRGMYIAVNGGEKKMLDFASTGGYSSENMGTMEQTIALKAGLNTIEMGNADGYAPDIDRITLKPAAQ